MRNVSAGVTTRRRVAPTTSKTATKAATKAAKTSNNVLQTIDFNRKRIASKETEFAASSK